MNCEWDYQVKGTLSKNVTLHAHTYVKTLLSLLTQAGKNLGGVRFNAICVTLNLSFPHMHHGYNL